MMMIRAGRRAVIQKRRSGATRYAGHLRHRRVIQSGQCLVLAVVDIDSFGEALIAWPMRPATLGARVIGYLRARRDECFAATRFIATRARSEKRSRSHK